MVTIWTSIDKKQIDFSVLIFQQEFTRQLGFGFYHSSPEIQFVQRYSQVEKQDDIKIAACIISSFMTIPFHLTSFFLIRFVRCWF